MPSHLDSRLAEDGGFAEAAFATFAGGGAADLPVLFELAPKTEGDLVGASGVLGAILAWVAMAVLGVALASCADHTGPAEELAPLLMALLGLVTLADLGGGVVNAGGGTADGMDLVRLASMCACPVGSCREKMLLTTAPRTAVNGCGMDGVMGERTLGGVTGMAGELGMDTMSLPPASSPSTSISDVSRSCDGVPALVPGVDSRRNGWCVTADTTSWPRCLKACPLTTRCRFTSRCSSSSSSGGGGRRTTAVAVAVVVVVVVRGGGRGGAVCGTDCDGFTASDLTSVEAGVKVGGDGLGGPGTVNVDVVGTGSGAVDITVQPGGAFGASALEPEACDSAAARASRKSSSISSSSASSASRTIGPAASRTPPPGAGDVPAWWRSPAAFPAVGDWSLSRPLSRSPPPSAGRRGSAGELSPPCKVRCSHRPLWVFFIIVSLWRTR